ncbi:hypothetical protein vseg_013674 [Gypsophila vaccaria]
MSLLLIVTTSITITLANGVNLVPQTCKTISISEPNVKYDFCVTALGTDPRSVTANLGQLAEISFNLTVSKSKSISKKIVQLLKNPKGFDKFQKNALADCQEMYSNVPDDLETGREALRRNDFNTASIEVSGAITYADTCEDGFKERKEFSPLANENRDFMMLASIPLVLIDLVKSSI